MYYITFFFGGVLVIWRETVTDIDGQPHHYPVRWSREPPPHLPSRLAQSSCRQWHRSGGGIRWRTRHCYGTGSLPVISVLSTLANLTNYSLTTRDLSLTRRPGFSTSADNPHIIKGHECSTTYYWR